MIGKFDYKKWQYYIIIGIVSFVTIFFLPFIGSEVGLAFQLPNTAAGWLVFVVAKLLVAVLNMLLFFCFMEQAKVNVKDNPKFIEANEILKRYGKKENYIPLGPEEWTKHEYKRKGLTITIGSIVSAIGLSQAVLTFDWISMLAYIFIILLGCIFGYLQMNVAEDYWTGQYYDYAKMVEEEMAMAKSARIHKGNVDICADCGGDILVSRDNNSIASTSCQ